MFKKSDFDDELSRPLGHTLPGPGPFTAEAFPIVEQAQVARLVTPHLFQYGYTQAPDGSALLYLSPLSI